MGERVGPLEAHLCDVAQAVRTHVGQVDRGGQRAQGVVGADVGGRLLAPDVLLAGREGEDEPAPPRGVVRCAHETPGQLADQFALARDEPDMRAAEAGWKAQLLALAHRDVRSVLARRRQHGQADRIDARDGQRAGVVRLRSERASVHEQPEKVRLLEDHGRRLLVRLAAFTDLDPASLAEHAKHLHVLRMDVAGNDDLVPSGPNESHHRRLGDGGCAVVKGRVGDVERRQLCDQGLEFEDRLERALARFRLVRRVGGVELRLGGHRRHCRGDEPPVNAAPPKCEAVGKNPVPIGQRRDLGHRFELRKTVRELERSET